MTHPARARPPPGISRPKMFGVMGLATIVVVAAMQHAMAQPGSPGETATQSAIPESKAGPQDTFRSQVQDEMAEWRRRMQSFDEAAAARGRRTVDASEIRLRAAWDDTELEARHVQAAAARDWLRTKQAYEAASRRMTVAWDKAKM